MPILAKPHFYLTFIVHFSNSRVVDLASKCGLHVQNKSCIFNMREVEIGSWVDVGHHLNDESVSNMSWFEKLVIIKRSTGFNELNQKSQMLPACFSVTMMPRRYPVPK